MRRWQEIYTEEERAIQQGFGASLRRAGKGQGLGNNPALLIINVHGGSHSRDANLDTVSKAKAASQQSYKDTHRWSCFVQCRSSY